MADRQGIFTELFGNGRGRQAIGALAVLGAAWAIVEFQTDAIDNRVDRAQSTMKVRLENHVDVMARLATDISDLEMEVRRLETELQGKVDDELARERLAEVYRRLGILERRIFQSEPP